MNKSRNIVFLDVDGVLNGYDRFWYAIFCLFKVTKSKKLMDYWHTHLGCSAWAHKVFYLSIITHLTHSDVVLSSCWRMRWETHNSPKRMRLKKLFKRFGVNVVDTTIQKYLNGRGEEISLWLSEHGNPKNYIIIDDETCDQLEHLDHIIKTRNPKLANTDMIQGGVSEKTGLRVHHIFKAIRLMRYWSKK